MIRRAILSRDARIKALEDSIKELKQNHADQRVINQAQKDFKDNTIKITEGSESSYKEIMTKLDGIKDSQEARFDNLREANAAEFKEVRASIHELELRLPKA